MVSGIGAVLGLVLGARWPCAGTSDCRADHWCAACGAVSVGSAFCCGSVLARIPKVTLVALLVRSSRCTYGFCALAHVDPSLWAARAFGLGLPVHHGSASRGSAVGGFRVCIGAGSGVAVPGCRELLGASMGLGYLLTDSQEQRPHRPPISYCGAGGARAEIPTRWWVFSSAG